MKKGDLVLVEWVDSQQPLPAWRHWDDLPAPTIIECESVGWIIQKDKKVLMLAPNMGEKDTDSVQCSGIINIPMVCITKISRLIVTS